LPSLEKPEKWGPELFFVFLLWALNFPGPTKGQRLAAVGKHFPALFLLNFIVLPPEKSACVGKTAREISLGHYSTLSWSSEPDGKCSPRESFLLLHSL